MNRIKSIGVVTAILVISILIILFNIKLNNINITKVKIGVIDSYISEETLNKLNIVNCVNYTNNCDETKNSHGKNTLQIIRKQCKNSEIHYASVLNEKNSTNIQTIISAVDWCINENVDIICMSLSTTENNELLENVIKKAIDNGIIITASCINFSNVDCYPAMYDNVISVSEGANKNAMVIIKNKKIAVKENGKKVEKTGTSVLTAYACGKIAKEKFINNKKIEDIVKNLNS